LTTTDPEEFYCSQEIGNYKMVEKLAIAAILRPELIFDGLRLFVEHGVGGEIF